MDSNTRIAFNTTILYAQLIITVSVNLFSTRLILNAMGVEDYGIVNLVAGIVAMLSFVQNSMAVSSQRFMSVYMGKHDDALQKRVFNTSFVLHLMFVVGIFLLLELCQPMIFNSSIQIPIERMASTKVLYQLTILGTLFSIISVPYDASMNAHEDMVAFSVISIVESLIRLSGALILLVHYRDKLVFYGLLIVAISLVTFILKYIYCNHNYKEARVKIRQSDRSLMKEMFSFAFWNMFGACAITGRNQGLAVILNTFLGVMVNAAYGIAIQVGGQLSNFTSAITKAMNPQIMQNAGAHNNNRVVSLALMQCKFSSLLLTVALVPLFLTLPYVLKLWLNIVPDNCVSFCRCFLIVNLLMQMTTGLMSAVQSSGKIRNYQVIVSCIIMLNLPIGYLLLRIGYGSVSVLICMILLEVSSMVFRAYYVGKIFEMKMMTYFKYVVIPVATTLLLDGVLSYCFNKLLLGGVSNIGTFAVSCLFSAAVGFALSFVALTSHERTFVIQFAHQVSKKITRK